MVREIDKSMVTQFADMMHVKAQQIQARLRPYVQIIQMTGDVFAYDGIGSVEAREVVGRLQPAEFQDVEHLRRKIRRRRFYLNLPIDDMDALATLIDPQSVYAATATRAMERVFDRVVAEEMFADVYTGRDFETTVTFTNDGGREVNATGGVTYETLLEAKENFIDDDVGTDLNESFVMGITGEEHTALMGEVELISGDYTRQFVVERGEIQSALGINLVKFAGNAPQPVLNVGSTGAGERSCFIMSSRAMVVGMSRDWEIKVQERSDYIDTTQVQITMILGAVRTEGALIQRYKTTAT